MAVLGIILIAVLALGAKHRWLVAAMWPAFPGLRRLAFAFRCG
jgi:hypothetical protein